MAYELLSQGTAFYSTGDYRAAIEKLRVAAAIGMNSFEAHYYLGLALSAARRYGDAIEPFETAIDLQPNHLQAHVALGDALLKLGDRDRADAEYHRALKIKEDFAPALDGMGRLAESQGKNGEAEEAYKRAIAANRGYPDPLLHLGDLAARSGNLDEAVSEYTQALRLRPDLGTALNKLGLAYGKLALYDEAIAVLDKAVSVEPKEPSHPTSLGKIYLLIASPARAADAFRHAIELDPDYIEAYEGLADARAILGEFDAALVTIDEALGRPSTDQETRTLLRKARERIRTERDETASLEKKLDEGAADPETLSRLASLEIAAGRYERALPYQERLTQTDRSPAALERLAFLYLQLGRYRDALPLYTAMAVGASPGAASLVNLGFVNGSLGDDKAAIEAYRRALSLDPGLLEARLDLGVSLYRSGDESGAKDALASYIASAPKGESSERVRKFLTALGWKPPSPAPSGGSP